LLRKLLPIHQLRQLPHNPVFRLVTHGRSGWVARGAFLTILTAEVAWLLWMGIRELDSGGSDAWMEYLLLCMGFHTLFGSLLLIGAMWAYHRPFTNAQKEDLWLTRMRPGQTVLAVMTPPCAGAALVIFGVPLLLVGVLLAFRLDAFLQWLLEFLAGGFLESRGGGAISIMGGWLAVIFVVVLFALYLVIFFALWRVLLEGLIRTGTIRIVLAVRGLFIALLSGIIAFQTQYYALAFLDSAGFVGLADLILPLSTIMIGLVMLLSSFVGAMSCLCQFPGRRWFAGVVTSIQDEQDWLAGEESSLAMMDSNWIRLTSPLGGRQIAFLPSAAVSGFVGAIVASVLLMMVEKRSATLYPSGNYDEDLYIIPAVILSGLLGGFLALRRGTFLSWRRHFLIQPGRIAASVRTTALLSAISCHVPAFLMGMLLLGADFDDIDEWGEILGSLIIILVTLLPIWMLHCVLLCLWRLPGLQRVTTIVMAIAVLAMILVMWYPDMLWSRSLAILVLMPMAGAVLFWINGGSYGLFQKLFDQERPDMAAEFAGKSPPDPEQPLEPSSADHS
jgi:hypothetical protein